MPGRCLFWRPDRALKLSDEMQRVAGDEVDLEDEIPHLGDRRADNSVS
jgi:hypothetical protein